MGWWSRIKRTFGGDRPRSEIEEELRFHLDMDVAQGQEVREARLRLGNATRIEEETRATGLVEWLDSVLKDVRYGARQLRKTPGLVLAIVLSLAIGLGANAAIFSLVDAAMLRPLPVNDADSLRVIEWTSRAFPEWVGNINGGFKQKDRVQASSVSAALYRRLAREQVGFEALIGVADANPVAVTTGSLAATQVSLQYVSSNFFQGLGVVPTVGRAFRPEEDRVGQEPVVVVSHRFWMSRLGGERDVVGRGLRINNVPARVAGVMPAGFFGLQAGQWTDIYAPLAMRVAFATDQTGSGARGEDDRDWWVRQMGRLKTGVTEAAAREQIATLFRNLAVPAGRRVERNTIPDLITLPGRRGFGALSEKDASALWMLMLLVGVLLLVVCLNVANLLLSRSVGKQRESAIRLALGAPRARLFRQHFIESGLLAVLGGAAGIAFGLVLAHGIQYLFQAGRDASSAFNIPLDFRLLAYTGVLSMMTAFLFGLAPAVQAATADLNDVLKAQTRTLVGGRMRGPRLLVSVQVALCLTALVAAGLLGRSLQNLTWKDVGFDRENLVYATVNPRQAGYPPERVGPYVERVREALARLPGVVRVSLVEVRLLSGNGNVGRVNIPGQTRRVAKGVVGTAEAASMNRVGDGLLETLRIPLRAGRTLERRDMQANASAVVVDERFARQYFPQQNPLGRRFGFFGSKENDRYQIVGVVGDSRYNSLRGDSMPAVYAPYVPSEHKGAIHLAMRANIDSGRLADEVRVAIAAIDPAVPLIEFHTQTALIDRLLRTERLLAFLSGAFGLIVLTLAAIGIGGLLAYAVASRTNEIGIRMAVGAAASDVVQMVLRDSFRMVFTGIVLGIPCAYAVAMMLRSALFELQALDVSTMAGSFFALLLMALLAAWLPARRAARIEPVKALRQE